MTGNPWWIVGAVYAVLLLVLLIVGKRKHE